MDLRPDQPYSELPVIISLSANKIFALFEYDKRFIEVMHDLRYKWERPNWTKQITPQTGSLLDRATELCYKLLEARFIVSTPKEIDQQRVINGDYEAEHTRWIYKRLDGQYKDWFCVNWSKREDYYQRAMRISGARYSKPSVVVPSARYDELMDFAEMYGFRLSDGAQKLLAEAQEKRNQQVRVELRPRVEAAKAVEVVKITGEIADEFRDDN